MAEHHYELTLKDYLGILKRRWPYLAGVFLFILAVAVVVAVAIPPIYQSTGTIMVESQQIPDELVPATVTSYADERIEVIKQRVMTRDNLIKIAQKYRLYEDQRTSLTPSELIDEMRAAINLELISADVKGRGKAVIAFRVSYEYRYAEVAHKVANELVTLFLDENVKARTERATETTEFLTQEADKLKVELEALETQLAAYKQEHANALPEHESLRLGMLQRTESELQALDREYNATKEELRFLDVELSAARAGVGTTTPGAAQILTPSQELEKLRIDQAKLASRLMPTHPALKDIARKIEKLEKSIQDDSLSPGGGPTAMGDVHVAKIQTRIDAANNNLAAIAQQQKLLKAKRAELERQIIQIPQVERGMVALMRDHDNAKRKYEEIRAKQMSAQIAENLEGEKKAERFTLLEPPLMPDKPIKPNRKKMIAMGFALATAGSGGLLMLLENLDQRVRGVHAVTALTRRPPLVIIPYIGNREELARRKRLIKLALAGSAAGLVILLLLVHFLYMPLDLALLKVLARFE